MKVSHLVEVSDSLCGEVFSDKAVFFSTEKAYSEDQFCWFMQTTVTEIKFLLH
jgi:hypothetical protein